MPTSFTPLIAPSLLAADLLHLGAEAQKVIDADADMLHLDIMDQHFVPNLSFGPDFCTALHQQFPNTSIDVHLMITPVDSMINAFIQAGANAISFHPEASFHVDRSLRLIKKANCKSGLVLNPATPLNVLDFTLDLIDFVLVMSVNPGFGGQKFIDDSIAKIKGLREKLDISGHPHIRIAVDGGVDSDNIGALAKAGADTFIAGSAIFKKSDYTETIRQFRKAIAHG